jgi:hypothetical protein
LLLLRGETLSGGQHTSIPAPTLNGFYVACVSNDVAFNNSEVCAVKIGAFMRRQPRDTAVVMMRAGKAETGRANGNDVHVNSLSMS